MLNALRTNNRQRLYRPSRRALIRPAPRVDIITTQPGLEAFTRVLVYVPGAQPKWIDPSAENEPLPLADQDRSALASIDLTLLADFDDILEAAVYEDRYQTLFLLSRYQRGGREPQA